MTQEHMSLEVSTTTRYFITVSEEWIARAIKQELRATGQALPQNAEVSFTERQGMLTGATIAWEVTEHE